MASAISSGRPGRPDGTADRRRRRPCRRRRPRAGSTPLTRTRYGAISRAKVRTSICSAPWAAAAAGDAPAGTSGIEKTMLPPSPMDASRRRGEQVRPARRGQRARSRAAPEDSTTVSRSSVGVLTARRPGRPGGPGARTWPRRHSDGRAVRRGVVRVPVVKSTGTPARIAQVRKSSSGPSRSALPASTRAIRPRPAVEPSPGRADVVRAADDGNAPAVAHRRCSRQRFHRLAPTRRSSARRRGAGSSCGTDQPVAVAPSGALAAVHHDGGAGDVGGPVAEQERGHAATSRGSPIRSIGIRERCLLHTDGVLGPLSVAAALITPGATALTRMPRGASCTAKCARELQDRALGDVVGGVAFDGPQAARGSRAGDRTARGRHHARPRPGTVCCSPTTLMAKIRS